MTFQFDDIYGTTVSDKVTIKIVNGGTEDEPAEDGTGDGAAEDKEESESTVTE